jgi:hypothetical protein
MASRSTRDDLHYTRTAYIGRAPRGFSAIDAPKDELSFRQDAVDRLQ